MIDFAKKRLLSLMCLECSWYKDVTQSIDRTCPEEKVLHDEPEGLSLNMVKEQFCRAQKTEI